MEGRATSGENAESVLVEKLRDEITILCYSFLLKGRVKGGHVTITPTEYAPGYDQLDTLNYIYTVQATLLQCRVSVLSSVIRFYVY